MIKTVIIEDELAGQELIRHYLKKHPSHFEVVAVIDNVKQAVEFLSENTVDLVLMDVHIKQGTGFDVFAQLPNKEFETIFITAYNQFAIQAIKQRAFDYILKPLLEDEFLTALQKVQEKITGGRADRQESSHIVITQSGRIERVNFEHIIFFEADGAYTHIQTLKDKIHTSKNLGEYEAIAPGNIFMRSHHSYLVNMDHVIRIEKKRSGLLHMSNGFQVPVSQRKITEFVQSFKKRHGLL